MLFELLYDKPTGKRANWARDWLEVPQRERRRQHHAEPPLTERKPAADYDAEQAEKAKRAVLRGRQ